MTGSNLYVIVDGNGKAYAIASDRIKAYARMKELSEANKGMMFHLCESVYTFYTPTQAEKENKDFWHN